jgi:hypothetical protein
VLYVLVPLSFAWANSPINALPAAVLLTVFVGTGSSFLAFATIVAKRGLALSTYPTKGLYYLGGLIKGFETIAFFVAIHLFPAAFPMLAYAFAAACGVTTITRWYQGWRGFPTTARGTDAPDSKLRRRACRIGSHMTFG